MNLIPLLAAVSEPAPPGRTPAAGVAVILLCLAAGISLAVRAFLRRGDGEGGTPPPSAEK